MPSTLRKRTKPSSEHSPAVAGLERWKLEDAKARLSEVVRRAETKGPQLVTIRGKEAAVILAPEQYKQLLPKNRNHQPLVRFLRNLDLSGLDLEREIDTGRNLDL
jgi:antitoxin Phd